MLVGGLGLLTRLFFYAEATIFEYVLPSQQIKL